MLLCAFVSWWLLRWPLHAVRQPDSRGQAGCGLLRRFLGRHLDRCCADRARSVEDVDDHSVVGAAVAHENDRPLGLALHQERFCDAERAQVELTGRLRSELDLSPERPEDTSLCSRRAAYILTTKLPDLAEGVRLAAYPA